MKAMIEKLGITASYSRPRLSNDNPFSEALFRTCKYRPDWLTKGFATKAEAQAWGKFFTNWYNGEHLHSAIRFVTPNARHAGHDRATLKNLATLYANARTKNRSAGQAIPVTGNPREPPSLTQKPTSAPLKPETLHETGGQLL